MKVNLKRIERWCNKKFIDVSDMISTNQQSRKGKTVKQRPSPSKQNKDLEKFEEKQSHECPETFNILSFYHSSSSRRTQPWGLAISMKHKRRRRPKKLRRNRTRNKNQKEGNKEIGRGEKEHWEHLEHDLSETISHPNWLTYSATCH